MLAAGVAHVRPEADFYHRPSSLPNTVYFKRCRDGSKTLQALMGLSGDDDTFMQYVDRMTELIVRHLDMERPWSQQLSAKREKYTNSVRKHVPEVFEYDEGWPSMAFARIYLGAAWRGTGTRRTGPSTRGRGVARCIKPVSQAKFRSQRADSLRPRTPPARAAASSEGNNQPEPERTQRGRKAAPAFHRNASPGPSSSLSARIDAHSASSASRGPSNMQSSQESFTGDCRQTSHSCRRDAEEGGPHEPVLSFLLSLALPLPDLLPVLCTRGVQDGMSLLALARLSDKSDWLLRVLPDVPLLHQKFLVDGLDQLAQA